MFIFSDPLSHGSVRSAIRREARAGIGHAVGEGVDERRAESYCLA